MPLCISRSRCWLQVWCVVALLTLAGCGNDDSDKLNLPNGAELLRLPGLEFSGKEPILALKPDLFPINRPAFQQVKRDFFECKGLLAPWYQKLILAEMNHLAEHDKLAPMPNPVCLISLDKQMGHGEGRYKIHLYMDMDDLKECEMNLRCTWARNVSLVVKNKVIYRSYFLSDFKNDHYYQHCVTADNHLHLGTTCYTVD